jgi:drug/metabolite transporter (DMT)-like permease
MFGSFAPEFFRGNDGLGMEFRLNSHMTKATAIGASAILMWATLALLTAETGAVPPFQLVAMSFGVAALTSVAFWRLRGRRPAAILRQPPGAWALGVGGLFGYHFFYFLALRQAPPLQANLINYLWPLLIVLFSALLPGERLLPRHVVGALLGLSGAVLLVTRDGSLDFAPGHLLGYGAALACAVTWAGYSVANRRYRSVPTDAVGGFCAATAVLAVVCHLAFETTVWPSDAGEWLAALSMGLGPVGAAFFVWDHGCKHGDIRTLGLLSYATPLLSTGLLIAFGRGEPTAEVAVAAALIVGGALVGTAAGRRRVKPA